MEAERDRGAPENGDLRVRHGCGWLQGFCRWRRPHRCRRIVTFAANVTPLRLFERGPPRVYTALLRGIYIIRPRLESNIMNHAPCPSRA